MTSKATIHSQFHVPIIALVINWSNMEISQLRLFKQSSRKAYLGG